MKIDDFKQWLNDNRSQDVSSVFHDLVAQVGRVIEERDEADRRAGAAERTTAYADKENIAHRRWLSKAKKQWGVSDYVSFDKVWEEALNLKKAADGCT